MTTSHLLSTGLWAVCLMPESCELLFHVPGMTPAEVEELPGAMLEQLLEAVDPPHDLSHKGLEGKFWRKLEPEAHEVRQHRDYDLPAAIFASGRREWRVNGRYHRGNDLPAVVSPNGERQWWVNGKRHRNNGLPAEASEAHESWWFHGRRHRSGGRPAMVLKNEAGAEVAWGWFWFDLEHRLSGPAVIEEDGSMEWWRFGSRHRLFGPAVIHADGSRQWWLFDRQIWPQHAI